MKLKSARKWSGLADSIPRPGTAAFFCIMFFLGAQVRPANGQLAITEAMSWPSINTLSDFWELTNFGTNDISLNGYKWNDNAGGRGGDAFSLDGLTISNRETIVLVQTNLAAAGVITNELSFRAWWGSNLPASTRVILYSPNANGFSRGGDGIRLWGPAATNDADVIDSVDFGDAVLRPGSTFTYDPDTGLFDYFSVEGVGGAFKSATFNDIGSPGITTPPVPLQILSQPASVSVCAGIDAMFSITAGGMPRSQYQWFFNGAAIPGAVSARLTIANAQATNDGTYRVQVSNGFQNLQSDEVTLSVNTNPTPPTLYVPLADVQVLSNETARFTATVCAFPPPAFQWTSNGVVIPGATNRTLVIQNSKLAMSGTLYCVRVQNALRSNSFCARLTVSPFPRLVITEVMPAGSPECLVSSDWFELTNFDTNVVNLLGYRFATGNNQSPSLEGARVVTEAVILNPGESAIFVRNLTAAAFIDWWGADRLPANVKIIPFFGVGLDQAMDELYIWSSGAENALTRIAEVSWAGALGGVSKWFDTDGWEYDSVAGERGAFISAQCGNVGSPGYTTNPPPRFAQILRGAAGVTLKWRAVPNATYQLKWKNSLSEPLWMPLATRLATNWVETFLDASAANASQRFYFLEQQP